MSALQSVGTIVQGDSAKKASEYNAASDEYNAAQVQNDAAVKIQQQQRTAAQVIGNEKAQYGASGISSNEGSAFDVLKQSIAQSAMDSINIQNTANARSYGYERSAVLKRFEGEQAQSASYFTAAGQLLGGAAQVAGAM